jgi:flavodoxin
MTVYVAGAQGKEKQVKKGSKMSDVRSLIAYFSRRGNNYVDGKIVNLLIGNTEVIAKKLQGMTGSNVFRIDTISSYPDGYTETTEVAQEEKKRNARPELTGKVGDMESCQVIYLGYPNWWGTMPMAVFTFLDAYGFSGKTIIPFCTHEGSGMGSSERDIKRLCPNARVLPGLAIRGGSVGKADKDLLDWLRRLDMIPRTKDS